MFFGPIEMIWDTMPKKIAMDLWKFAQYLQYTKIFVLPTSWTLSNIIIAYSDFFRVEAKRLKQFSPILSFVNFCFLCNLPSFITDVRKFSRGQKTIISVYCKYCPNFDGSVAYYFNLFAFTWKSAEYAIKMFESVHEDVKTKISVYWKYCVNFHGSIANLFWHRISDNFYWSKEHLNQVWKLYTKMH